MRRGDGRAEILSIETLDGAGNPTAVWKKLAAELEVEIVPGDHLGMIITHFKSLAAVLSRYVEEVSRQEMSEP